MGLKIILYIAMLAAFAHISLFAYTQTTNSAGHSDTTKTPLHISGNVSVTNNGISIIPTFSLNKPAANFIASVGKTRFSFDPEYRISLAGRPWSLVLWLRYKPVVTKNFSLRVGAHPALNFKTETDSLNGVARDINVARRYVAAEIAPNYKLSKNISVGMYYLQGHGLDDGAIKYSHYLTVNSNFSHIKITNGIYLNFVPQFYYLNLVKEHGFYFTSFTEVGFKNFPVSVSSVINKTINTNITGSKDFVWNVSLVYSFSKEYAPK